MGGITDQIKRNLDRRINMLSKLNESRKNMTLVALYSNENNTDAFAVGYICEIKDGKVLMLNVGIHGEYDGYSGIDLDDIFRVEVNSKYLSKILMLKSFDESEKMLNTKNKSIFECLIDFAQTHNKICVISYGDNGEIRGFVKKSENELFVQEFDDYGDIDGENIINVDVINKIMVDDVDCRDIEILSRYKQ